MALIPTRQALDELNNSKKNKQNQLAQAYAELGGSNTALTPNYAAKNPTPTASIPTLERAVVSQYNKAVNSGGIGNVAKNPTSMLNVADALNAIRGEYGNAVQENAQLVNDLRNAHTRKVVEQNPSISIATTDTIMGMGNNAFGMPTTAQANAGVTQEDLQRLYGEELKGKKENRARQIAEATGIGGSAMATISRPIESAIGVAQNIGEYLTGKPISQTYTPSTIMRETVSNNIDSNVGKVAYGGVNSLSDMILAILLSGGNPNVSSGIMGVEKASDVMNDANARGLNPNQILGEGVLSGVATGITERLPFGRFSNGGSVLGSMAAEGLQEGAEDLADSFFDELVTRMGGNADKSTLRIEYNDYINAGYSPEEAMKAVGLNYAKQLGLDIGLGGITGGLMQGGSNFLQGNNIFSGKPRTQAETQAEPQAETQAETQAEEQPTIIPALNSRAEESAIQNRRNEELAILSDAYSQIQREENARAEEQAREKAEEMKFMSDLLADTSYESRGWQTAQTAERNSEESNFLRNALSDIANDSMNWQTAQTAERNSEESNYLRNALSDIANDSMNWEIPANIPVVNSNLETAQKSINSFIDGLNMGLISDADTAYRNLANSLIQLGNNDPSIQQNLNQMWSQANEAYKAYTGQATQNEQVSQTEQPTVQTTKATAKSVKKLAQDYINRLKTSDNSLASDYVDIINSAVENVNNAKGKKREFAVKELQSILEDVDNAIKNDTAEQTARDNEGLPEDVANLTEETVEPALDNEINRTGRLLRMGDLNFFSEDAEADVPVLNSELHTGRFKTSKFARNTFPRSGVMTDEEYDTIIPEDIRKTERITHPETLEAAEKNIKNNGYSGSYNELLDKENWTAVDVDTAMMCCMHEAENARKMAEMGADPIDAWNAEVQIFKKAKSQATAGGQLIESFKKWSALTPEGKLGQAIAFVNEAIPTKKSTNDPKADRESKKIPTAAEQYLSDEFMAEFLKKAHQYDGQDVSFAKKARLNAELAHMVNSQIPVKFRQKFTSLWMDNLLASFRTLISRNFGGNIGKAALDQSLVKLFSGPIDSFISRYTGTRTTTGLTKEGLKTYGRGFLKGGKQTVRDYWTPNADPDAKLKLKDLAKEIDVFADANVTNRSGVNEDSFKEALGNNRIVFKNKALRLYDKVIKFGLAVGDNPFYKATYDQTLYELNRLRDENKLSVPEDLTDEEFETWAKGIATAQGLEAVYQDNSDLAKGATDIKNGLAKMSEGYVGFDFLSGASMPFVRTPMNVIKTNLELSPLGIVKNAVTTIKEINDNLEHGRSAFDTKSFEQRRFVRETSRNLVGLILFAAGLGLKNAGLLTGGYSDDPKEKQAQKDAGMQEYALVNPFNGNQYSIDWIPGLGSSMISASAFEDEFSRPEQDTLDALINGVKAGSQSMFEQAALQGLRRLTGADSYTSDGKLVDNVAQTVANTASSAIMPSFVRQSAAALDPYKRNTYGMGGKESILNNAIAGIPFLRQTLEPRIGLNGEPMEQNAGRNTAQKWFDNLINPAMVTVPSYLQNSVRDEAARLYEATKDGSVFQPVISRSYLDVDGNEHTVEEYTEFLRLANGAMNETANELIQSEYYNSLTDDQKVACLKDVYSAVRAVERSNYLGLGKEFDGAEKAYEEGGTEGLLNYITAKSVLKDLGMPNNPTNRDHIIETLNNGGAEAVQQMASQAQELADAGLDTNMQFKYEHASKYIPTLTPTQFAETWNTINTDNNTSIKISEVLDYLNQNPNSYNQQTATELWNAYYTGTSAKLPVLNADGYWEAK